MDTEEYKDTQDKAPSVVDRYYTRWYRAGKYRIKSLLRLASWWLIKLTIKSMGGIKC